MKKILLILTLSVLVFAKSDKLSSVPLPDMVFISIEPGSCDNGCLEDLYEDEQYFSFLANYNANRADEKIADEYGNLASLFNLTGQNFVSGELQMGELIYNEKESGYAKLAILVPQKVIRRYSMTTVNSIVAYLLARNSAFDIEVFNCEVESPESINNALYQIRQKGYKVIIAPVTPTGASILAQSVNDMLVFIPTTNHTEVPEARENILFGGIDYNEQIQVLSSFANDKIAVFSDGSTLGTKLDWIVRANFPNIVYEKQLPNKKLNLKYVLKGNSALTNASIFVNMPLVKTSLLASQLRAYDIPINSLLSTQINYHPMLLSMSQPADREKLYMANAIQNSPLLIRETNSIFGHSIVYDWVNYASSVGLDYLFTHYFTDGNKPMFQERIDANQVKYSTRIMKANAHGFYSIAP